MARPRVCLGRLLTLPLSFGASMTLEPIWLVVIAGLLIALAVAWQRAASRAEAIQQHLNQATQRLSEHQEDLRALQSRLDRISRDHDQQLERRRCDTLNDLLPIDDHLSRAVAHSRDATTSADLESLRHGIELCARDLDRLWLSCGLQRLNPAPSTPFDPSIHEAIASHPHPAVTQAVVAQVFAAGFQMGGHLLRPARVLVHTPPPNILPDDADPLPDDAPPNPSPDVPSDPPQGENLKS